MDYGEDWPPLPEKAKPPAPTRRRRLRLWEKCAIAIAGYTAIALLGLLAVHIFQPPIHTGEPSQIPHSTLSSR
jgi:hypothetical protein